MRFDREGEFTSREFNIFFEANGIKRQLFSPRTPKQYGITERRTKSIVEVARMMFLRHFGEKQSVQ